VDKLGFSSELVSATRILAKNVGKLLSDVTGTTRLCSWLKRQTLLLLLLMLLPRKKMDSQTVRRAENK